LQSASLPNVNFPDPFITHPSQNHREVQRNFRMLFPHTDMKESLYQIELNPQGEFLHFDTRLCQVVGYSESLFRHFVFLNVVYPDDSERFLKSFRYASQHPGEETETQVRIFDKNGYVFQHHLCLQSQPDVLYGKRVFITAYEPEEPVHETFTNEENFMQPCSDWESAEFFQRSARTELH
jgi:PAS domain-containing protein